jgi:cell wall-associated NlpC family hydrolase
MLNQRKMIIAVGCSFAALFSSLIIATISPIETDVVEEPPHINADRYPASISSSDLLARSPLSYPVIKAKVFNLSAVSKYRLRAGDTLGKLATAWHIKVSKLACRNGIQNPDVVFPGKWIFKNGTEKCKTVAAVQPVQRTVHITHSSSAVEIAITFAINQVGDPYVWSGDGPDGWDCSGLVHAAFANAGIHISRTTRTLINDGYAVSHSGMQRGDLVFPSGGHVGIYLGDGQMVHSPQPGETVKVSDVYDFYAARRVT